MTRIYLALASAVLFITCQEASAQICKPVAERTARSGVGSSPISLSDNSISQRPFGTSMSTRPGLRLKQQKLLAAPLSSLLERCGC